MLTKYKQFKQVLSKQGLQKYSLGSGKMIYWELMAIAMFAIAVVGLVLWGRS